MFMRATFLWLVATIGLLVVGNGVSRGQAPKSEWMEPIDRTRSLELLFMGFLDRELEIVPEQQRALAEIAARRKESIRSAYDLQVKGQTRHESVKRVAESTASHNREALEEISHVLLPHQQNRWRQIGLQLTFQNEPSRALLTTEFAKKLEITQEQRQALQDTFKAGERDLVEAMALERERRDAKMMQLLTPKQRMEFNSVFGKPFDPLRAKRAP
jgi:hypothetical protein